MGSDWVGYSGESGKAQSHQTPSSAQVGLLPTPQRSVQGVPPVATAPGSNVTRPSSDMMPEVASFLSLGNTKLDTSPSSSSAKASVTISASLLPESPQPQTASSKQARPVEELAWPTLPTELQDVLASSPTTQPQLASGVAVSTAPVLSLPTVGLPSHVLGAKEIFPPLSAGRALGWGAGEDWSKYGIAAPHEAPQHSTAPAVQPRMMPPTWFGLPRGEGTWGVSSHANVETTHESWKVSTPLVETSKAASGATASSNSSATYSLF